MKYAIMENGVVKNIARSNRALAANWVQLPADSPVQVGDCRRDGCFYAPDGSMRMTPEMAAAAKQIAALQEELTAAKILLGMQA